MNGARRSVDGSSAPPPSSSSIRVACRIRPTNPSEVNSPSFMRAQPSEGTITASSVAGDSVFSFDAVLAPGATQADVYDATARRVVADFLDGFNGTVFAYGQTGSGKTHTIMGDIASSDGHGIAPRAFDHVFDAISASPPSSEFLLRASFVEIYLEKVRDLLDPRKTDLRIREGASAAATPASAGRSGVWIEGAEEVRLYRCSARIILTSAQVCVSSPAECLALLSHGLSSRAAAPTHMNERSSRSHAVFMLSLLQKGTDGHGARVSQLFLVDLAGSERVKKSRVEGDGLDQAVAINKSLHALGNATSYTNFLLVSGCSATTKRWSAQAT
jgi:kinesin family protein 5